MDNCKRPNTKGLISRRFRQCTVELRIINVNTEELRTRSVELIDKKDPIKAAREQTRLEAGEMILKAAITSDRYIVVTQTPDEFLFNGRILEYIPILHKETEQ